MREVSRSALVICAVSGILLAGGSPHAWAGVTSPDGSRESDTSTKGNANDEGGQGTISASAGVSFDRSKNGTGPAAGPVVAAGNWTPPPCWYAPKYTPDQLKAYLEPIWASESTGYEWDAKQRKHYEKGDTKDGDYKDFNKDKTGKGYWWDSYVNHARIGEPGALACDKAPFWVDKGAPPPPDIPQAITPEILSQLAYAEIRVPGTKVTLAPSDGTKVNLPTWAWLDKTDFQPVSVTASVPVLDIQATTTATPVSLKIEPGTSDAELYPASGECAINGDGSIGSPYVKGDADKTPPCGLTYLRASGNKGPYKLAATITWNISWTGTGHARPTALPSGTFGTAQDVTVDEIQAINR
jgi:enoyl reductase